MRVAVLPRGVAAQVITSAIARGAWGVNIASLGLTIPLLCELLVRRDEVDGLPAPLAIVIGMLALTVVAFFVPRPPVVAAYLLVGAAAAVCYELLLLAVDPGLQQDALFLLNRPTVSLVLVGAAATTTITGILWSSVGLVLSLLVPVVVSVQSGVPLVIGWGPLLVFGIYLIAYLTLESIQASQRRRVPNFEELEQETRRHAVEEQLRARVASAVHDTLLNDLSIVMNAPDTLDPRMIARLREDLATLTSAEWLRESAEVVTTDEQDSTLRNEIMQMISELQWRGLTVHVTGSGTGIYRLSPQVASAALDAIRACLENVLRHAGTTVAEVDLSYTHDWVAIMVSDEGSGFDPDAVADDRLGLSQSVVDRIRRVGGSVRIWSTPGGGTSVLMRVPVVELVAEHDAWPHQEALGTPTAGTVPDAR